MGSAASQILYRQTGFTIEKSVTSCNAQCDTLSFFPWQSEHFLCLAYINLLLICCDWKDGKVFSPASHSNLVDETNQRLLALPHRRTDAGKYSLLRIVASFPAQTNLKRCLEEDPDDEGHPIASLNMHLVKQVTRRLSPIDFLQGLEDPLRNNGKRKRGVENKITRYQNKKLKI